ncbi:unknown [Akkermansia sp. CAG:344]|nr:unknown [Akkermansia sp. CAG:344]
MGRLGHETAVSMYAGAGRFNLDIHHGQVAFRVFPKLDFPLCHVCIILYSIKRFAGKIQLFGILQIGKVLDGNLCNQRNLRTAARFFQSKVIFQGGLCTAPDFAKQINFIGSQVH